jgi:hypothetical protein
VRHAADSCHGATVQGRAIPLNVISPLSSPSIGKAERVWAAIPSPAGVTVVVELLTPCQQDASDIRDTRRRRLASHAAHRHG